MSEDRARAVEAGVLAATERLLRSGAPFSRLSMQRIADEADVARSTLYLYFREKDTLLVRLAAGLKDGSFALMSGWTPDDEDALDGLGQRLLKVIGHYREQAPVLRAMLELAESNPDVGRLWEEELGPFQRLNQGWIEHAVAQGRTAADIDPVTASQVIIHGGFRVITQQALSGVPERDRTVARELAASQWYGTFRRPGPH